MPRTLNDNVAVFDIDGCISNDEWRRSRIPASAAHPLQFEYYHAACSDDPPLINGARLLNDHIARGDFIIFATARPFKVAEQTATWVRNHFAIEPETDFTILMRKDDDARSAVEVKQEFANFLKGYAQQTNKKIIAAYDDRQDVIDMYRANGFAARLLNAEGLGEFVAPQLAAESLAPLQTATPEDLLKTKSAADILESAAKTYRERNEGYKDNAVMVGALMQVMFPHGVTLRTADDHHAYHLFELMIVKLTRFVKSNLKHVDSIHDLSVYAAMVEALAESHAIEVRNEWSDEGTYL